MKAMVYEEYGSPDVIKLKDVNMPTLKDDEVLVKIKASSVNKGNLLMVKGEPLIARPIYGFLKPKHKIQGGDIAGIVEDVGKSVKKYRLGDEVFADLSSCGFGAYAEYVAVPEKWLVLKPSNMSYEEAAAVPMAGVTALQGLLRKGKIQCGQKVLIYGASGGIGTFAVQIAKAYGTEVTAVCSTRNLEMAHWIGADRVIDYTVEDFSKDKEKYDLILAANGYNPIAVYKKALNPNGVCVMSGGTGAQAFEAMLVGPWISKTSGKTMVNLMHWANVEDLTIMKNLIEVGKIKAIIDRRYTLSEVPEALKYLGQGHAKGKVVISI